MNKPSPYFLKVLYVVTGVLFFSGCSQVKYNAVDIVGNPSSLGVEKPVEIAATNNTYTDCVYISWIYTRLVTTYFDIYRSTAENGAFTLIGDNCEDYSYSDTDAVPGILYYYKIKAVSLTYGESEFSDAVAGMRCGSPADRYESQEVTSDKAVRYLAVETDTTYQRSIYPEKDVDYFKITAKAGDFKKIQILSSGNNNADINSFKATFYNQDMGEIISFDKFEIGKTFTLSSPSDNIIYMDLSAYYAARTGDYQFLVTDLTSDGYLEPPTIKSNHASYIKLQWLEATFVKYYKIQRRMTESEEWTFVNVSKSLFRKDTTSSVTSTFCYDTDVSGDITYYYRICGYPNDAMFCTSSSAEGRLCDVTTDKYEPDESFPGAHEFTIPLTETRSISENDDIDLFNIPFEKGKSYTITVTPDEDNMISADIYLYDTNGTLLVYIPPTEDSAVKIDNWCCPESGNYYIKVTGVNLKGKYTLSIPQPVT